MSRIIVIEPVDKTGIKIKLDGTTVQFVPTLSTAKIRATTLALSEGEEEYSIKYKDEHIEIVKI